MARREWIVYPRRSGRKRKGWEAGFWDPDRRVYMRRMLYEASGRPVASRAVAEELARQMWQDGVPGRAGAGLAAYLAAFWVDAGEYARDRADQGRALST